MTLEKSTATVESNFDMKEGGGFYDNGMGHDNSH